MGALDLVHGPARHGDLRARATSRPVPAIRRPDLRDIRPRGHLLLADPHGAPVFIDHHPGTPAALLCPTCDYTYPPGGTDCPTNAVVRPLLYQRRNEDPQAMRRLNPDQLCDLHDRRLARANRAAERTASAIPTSDSAAPLIDHTTGGQP